MRAASWGIAFILLAGLCGCSSLDHPTTGGGPNNPEPVSYTRRIN